MKNAITLICCSLFAISLKAQDITGDWEGDLSIQGTTLRIVFHIDKAGEEYTATMDSPNQGARGIPVEKTSFQNGELTLAIPSGGIEFKARPDEGYTQLDGTFTQMGNALPLVMVREGQLKSEEEAVVKSENAAQVAGNWHGVLDVQGMQLPLVVHITNNDDVLSATLDSPSQNANDIPVKEISFQAGTLSFKIPAMTIEYSGKADQDFQNIKGDFRQMGQKLELNFSKKQVAIEKPRRPQEPKAPFPYRSEQVSYENKAAKLKLAATLTLPEGEGPFPAAILISGSGPQNRDEELLGHKPFLVLSDHLTRQGIAVLRYDDRGVGESTGNFASATSADFATDVRAGIDYLNTRKEIDHQKIGLVGHSEGGLIAPMVSSNSEDVAYIVMLAGPGVDGGAILAEQSALIAKAEGSTKEEIQRDAEVLQKALDLVRSEADEKELKMKLTELLNKTYDGLSEEDKAEVGRKELFVDATASRFISPWMRYFISYDPQPALEKTKCPVLAIVGEKDLQVPPHQNMPAIEAALKRGGNTQYTMVTLPGLNHLFQSTETGATSEYARLEETFSAKALEVVSQWIKAKVQ